MQRAIVLLLPLAFAPSYAEAAPPRKSSAPTGTIFSLHSAEDEARYKRDLAKMKAEAERYTGLSLSPDKSDVAKSLEKADFVPRERAKRFSWITEHYKAVVTGWQGEILEKTPCANGATLVKLKVTPKHDADPSLRTTDFTIETYYVSKSGVRHIGTTFPPNTGIVTIN